MTMNQDVIIARIIAASKDIFACEKAIVTLKDIYHLRHIVIIYQKWRPQSTLWFT
ncbi:MAG: hypothetical protein ACL7AY_15595 [Candidatus Arsenophonus phytopathogenicus]